MGDFEAKTIREVRPRGVMGLGYVGLPLAHVFVQSGVAAAGFDNDPTKVEQLIRGESYIKHFGSEKSPQ